jgi:hypothetical protein
MLRLVGGRDAFQIGHRGRIDPDRLARWSTLQAQEAAAASLELGLRADVLGILGDGGRQTLLQEDHQRRHLPRLTLETRLRRT